jgi:predicted acetyltransferase
MSWKPRVIDPEELDATADLTAMAFGIGPSATASHRAGVVAALEVDRTLVVEDNGVMVGTGSAFSFELAAPGGALPMAGISWVGVRPTHRRRGILRALLDALVDQALDRGEPAAGLTASEGGIYRRFGYGVAARLQRLTIDTARSAELTTSSAVGQVRLASETEAATIMPDLWRRYWPRIPGEVGRTPGWWRASALDPKDKRHGASARFVVVHEDGRESPDGYAAYRVREHWRDDGAHHELRIEEVVGVDDAVEAALLRYLLDVDLVETVRWAAPLDLPLRWRLADSRAVHVTAEQDHLWLRPLDVARCLGGRRYAAEGSLVIEVVDGVRPELGGRFRLDGGAGGAEAARTDAEPDVTLAMPDLGAALLGGVTWSTLGRAGLVHEGRAGALTRADTMFRPDRAPFCTTDF